MAVNKMRNRVHGERSAEDFTGNSTLPYQVPENQATWQIVREPPSTGPSVVQDLWLMEPPN